MPSPFGRDRFDEARLINIANALTAFRVLLVPVFAHFLISGRIRHALYVFAACGISDGLDGLLARLLKQRTLVGFYLDPIADKLLMATSFIVLAYVKIIPEWLTILVISRDLFILVGSFLILILLDSGKIKATFFSKMNTAVQILTVIYFLAMHAFPGVAGSIAPGAKEAVTEGVVILCALTTAITGVHYLFLGMRDLSNA
ncbi:MAG: CDP-alcohol phosphatidyltransferase family protein [Deltaproteobacteria bacterium]|nr:CDP-alcohol phosphatidyltransferase family protein [Deltaproteobacteria bacterium]